MVRPRGWGNGVVWVMDIEMNKRMVGDRRAYSLETFWICLRAPRRMRARRSGERRYAVLDRFDSGVVTFAILLMILSVMDSVFTLTLISRGGTEVNPFMNAMLMHSIWAFISVKMLLTAIPAVVLVATGNLLLFKRFRAKSVLAAMVGLYIGLIMYELALLYISH